ncbi:recombinase RecT [Ancylobacter polymorphus]|uniref:Recombinase RecT n=1 Tax=Ancylobacter polymorphus TaxID=223390 RepID=A0ABU0B6F6_9HYPH|nr:recombinase RecT [Ancylobacter polymorphus]MDQ0301412.1 hypothetical protein [Ancylobacter polymorphus]
MSNEVATREERLAARVDTTETRALPISSRMGGVAFSNMQQVMEFSKLMALSDVAVPKFMRMNPGSCLAVTMQAIEWQMSPWAVANKAYSVNDRVGYESQLIHAVVLRRAPIKGRLRCEFIGDAERRRCRVWAILDDGTDEIVEYTSPDIGRIPVKNSPLWKGDPDQQLFYYSSRAFARRHFPDVILGIYTQDELYDRNDVRTQAPAARPDMVETLDLLAAQGPADEAVELAAKPSEPEKPKRERRQRSAAREDADASVPAVAAEASGVVDVVETTTSGSVANVSGTPAVAEADVVDDDPFAEGAEEVAAEAPSADDEAERIFTRMENLDVAPRGIDQSDVEQCRLFLEGHDAAHAKHPRTVPPDLKRRWIEDKDERARTLGICWMKGHDSVTGFTPPPPASKA